MLLWNIFLLHCVNFGFHTRPTNKSDKKEGHCDMMKTEIPAASRYDYWSLPRWAPALHYLPAWPPGGQLQSAMPEKMTDCEFMYIHSLAEDYLRYVLQAPDIKSTPSKTSKVLQRVAFSVQKEVEKNLKPYLDGFQVGSIDTARTIFNQVMEKEFEDGIINWGRIVLYLPLGVFSSKNFHKNRLLWVLISKFPGLWLNS